MHISESDVVLDGYGLDIDIVRRVSHRTKKWCVSLSQESLVRIGRSEALKNELVAAGHPIYGVTTGFGDSNKRQIPHRKVAEIQRHLIDFLGAGTGPLATPEVVRATMLIRANCLARGNSGVRAGLVNLLVDCLNADILPLIPERGSVGASGDLVPLSYLAAMLTGTGDVLHDQVVKPASAAFAETGLTALPLASKEGLALVNGTSFMSGFASVALHDARVLSDLTDLCTAMASQVLRGNPDHFTEFLTRHKNHPGVEKSASTIRGLLQSPSATTQASVPTMTPDAEMRVLDRAVQDPYSIRCAPHVTGVLRDTVAWGRQLLGVEINSSNDNPLFDSETGTVHNGGNFYGGHVGLAMDALKVAVASVGDLLDRQLQLLVDEKYNNGLTPNLIPRHATDPDSPTAGLHHGFKGMQLSASSHAAEALKLTTPATSFSRSTEAHNQDKVSMGTIAARDARTVVELCQHIVAIHLLALCQAADLRGLDRLSEPTLRAYQAIRAISPPVTEDRPLDGDIAAVVQLIARGGWGEVSP